MQRAPHSAALELPLEHLAMRLGQQQVRRVVLPEDIEEQAARRLQLSRGLSGARKSGKDESRHTSDLAKLPLRHLRGIERRWNVLGEMVRREEVRVERQLQRRLLRGQQLESIVV